MKLFHHQWFNNVTLCGSTRTPRPCEWVLVVICFLKNKTEEVGQWIGWSLRFYSNQNLPSGWTKTKQKLWILLQSFKLESSQVGCQSHSARIWSLHADKHLIINWAFRNSVISSCLNVMWRESFRLWGDKTKKNSSVALESRHLPGSSLSPFIHRMVAAGLLLMAVHVISVSLPSLSTSSRASMMGLPGGTDTTQQPGHLQRAHVCVCVSEWWLCCREASKHKERVYWICGNLLLWQQKGWWCRSHHYHDQLFERVKSSSQQTGKSINETHFGYE